MQKKNKQTKWWRFAIENKTSIGFMSYDFQSNQSKKCRTSHRIFVPFVANDYKRIKKSAVTLKYLQQFLT